MKNRERFLNLMARKPVDRIVFWESSVWWDKTIERWKGEGLPEHLEDELDIRDWFGLDRHYRQRVRPVLSCVPAPAVHGQGLVRDMSEYKALRPKIYPDHPFDRDLLAREAEEQRAGDLVIWFMFDGFFWNPRTLLGIEPHLYAFYQQPELMHRMNRDLLEYYLERLLPQIEEICAPDFVLIGEDMSYKNGPMISKALFDDFLAPYYNELIPALKKSDILPVLDTDGLMDDLIGWFLEAGIDTFTPMEIQAGNDMDALSRRYPTARFFGGYDKRVMSRDEEAMRAEFERILPVMRRGGYIPTTDHQVPPGVSLDQFRIYLGLLREYCDRACVHSLRDSDRSLSVEKE